MRKVMLLRMMKEKISFRIQITVSMVTIVRSWYLVGEDIHISIMNRFILVTLKL